MQTLQSPIKLDYSLESPEQRNEIVKKIIDNTPKQKLTAGYLKILADYIVFAMTKEEKKQKKINTENRMVTVNKREISFQGLVSKFENGEDSIYGMIANDKNIIFTPKVSITEEDLIKIPELKQLHDAILEIEKIEKTAKGKRKFLLKKQLIQMRQDQYIIKNSYNKPIYCTNIIKNFVTMSFDDDIKILKNGEIINKSIISLMNPKHISALLCNYSKLKQDLYGKFTSDGYYLMQDLQNLIDNALQKKYPLYYDLLIYKIDGKSNLEIQQLLYDTYNIKHSVQYISSLWRNKIPKLIAEQAQIEYLLWYYTFKEKGKWKKCSRCKQVKLAHNKFFSKNSSSKDGFYSICKSCRNKKVKKDNIKKSNSPKIIKKISYKKEKNNN